MLLIIEKIGREIPISNTLRRQATTLVGGSEGTKSLVGVQKGQISLFLLIATDYILYMQYIAYTRKVEGGEGLLPVGDASPVQTKVN